MQKVEHALTFSSFCLQICHCKTGTREIHWFSPTNQQGMLAFLLFLAEYNSWIYHIDANEIILLLTKYLIIF